MSRGFASILFFLAVHTLCSQTQGKLDVLSIEHGLSQGFVPAIAQDDDGFLWFATNNGLNRFDGYSFQVFKNDPFDPLSLDDNAVIQVVPMGDFLFVVTGSRTFSLFDRRTRQFHRFPKFPLPKDMAVIEAYPEGQQAVCLQYIDWSRNRIMLGRVSWPADRIGPGASARAARFEELPTAPTLFDTDLSADGKTSWMLDERAVVRRDVASGVAQTIPLPPALYQAFRVRHPSFVAADLAGAVWVRRGERLGRYDGRSWQEFPLPFDGYRLLCADRKTGRLWLAGNQEVLGFDLNKPAFDGRPDYRLPLAENAKCGFTDNFGNLWLGTDARGIRKFSPRTGIFKNYLDGFSVYCAPVSNGKGKVLLSDLRVAGGPWFEKILDLPSGLTRDLKEFGLPLRSGNHGCVAENGRFWLFFNEDRTNRPQLFEFDPETGSTRIVEVPDGYRWLGVQLKYVEPGQLWIASPQQLARFDLASRRFTVFETGLPAGPEIIAFEGSPDGTWWMGSADGLVKASPDGRGGFRFYRMTAEPGNRNSLPGSYIKSLLSDPADPNALWIGTNGHGLCRLDIVRNRFTHYSTRDGLPDDVVYGILADDDRPRKLWLSTNRGLARFSPETGLFQYFFKSDGLPDNEFNTFAAHKSPAGELMFGGVNGLTVFRPGDLAVNAQPPEVHFSSLEINGRPVGPRPDTAGFVLESDVAFLQRLELPFDRNSLLLQFAANDHTAPERNQFAYYLEGAESEWAHRGFEHSAQYLNLAPGRYTFRVKAANSNGVWSDRPIGLNIVVRAPWYRTGPAYFLYVGLITGAIFLLYKNQLRRKLDQREALRLKELDSFKSRLYTNLTHEFRTPLTVILGMTQQIRDEPERYVETGTRLIETNGQNLLRLINQLLDLSKLENNSFQLDLQQDDIVPYLRYLTESFRSYADGRGLALEFSGAAEPLVMDYDPEQIKQVLTNLLSNALKFTPPGGTVRVEVGRSEAGRPEGTPTCLIAVSDTGTGIAEKDLPHIFDRFYQASPPKGAGGGTGIGLAHTMELVKIMGGTVGVESAPGQGATFTVRLPVHNKSEHPKAGEEPAERRSPAPEAHQTLLPVAGTPLASLPTLLIIEDNPDVVVYLKACLAGRYRIDVAYDGKTGIEKAVEQIPGLIVSDVMMPEMDGFQVCDALKNDERTSHIPIVLLTARADTPSKIAGLRRGADAYLTKPFDREELLVRLEMLLERQKRLAAYFSRHIAGDQTPEAAVPEAEEESIQVEHAFLAKVRGIVEDRYSDENFGLPELCREIGMSRSQLFRKMKAVTDIAPSDFLRTYRLQKAKALLESGAFNVTEAAWQVGFRDPSYFSKLFQEAFGAAPGAVRK